MSLFFFLGKYLFIPKKQEAATDTTIEENEPLLVSADAYKHSGQSSTQAASTSCTEGIHLLQSTRNTTN